MELPDFISFDDTPDLLRASFLTEVLGRFATIFRQSGGDEATYAKSHPVSEISAFLSHNWSTPWTHKLVSLSFLFEVWPAALGTLLVQVACTCLSGVGILPTLRIPGYVEDTPELRVGVACRFVGVPVFLMLLLLMAEVKRWLGVRGQSVFLDKTCIHQSNKDIQREGICKLGAFLRRSRRMVVLFSETYLDRLWTVYEFACFLTLKPNGNIDLISVSLTLQICALMVIMCVWSLFELGLASDSSLLHAVLAACRILLLCPCVAWVQRSAARRLEFFQKQVSDFTVQRCLCACEDDRPLVYNNITELMRFSEVVPPTTGQEEALAAFDVIARSKLLHLVRDVTGRYGLRYSTCCAISVSLVIPPWLDECVQLFDGWRLPEFMGVTSLCFMQAFVFLPCCFALSAKLQSWNLRLHGLCERAYVGVCAWLVAAVCSGTEWFTLMMWGMANPYFEFVPRLSLQWAAGANIVLMAVGVATTVWLFELCPASCRASALACAGACGGACACVCPSALCKREPVVATPGTAESCDQADPVESFFCDPCRWEHLSVGS